MESRPDGWVHSVRRASVHAFRGVLHDIGHEIAVMNYLVHAVLDDESISHAARDLVELVGQQAARLSTLIERTFSQDTHTESVAVRPLLRQLVAQSRAAEGARVVLADGPPVELCIDPTILWRILANILGNAIRAAGSDGTVEVTATAGENQVMIDIADDGPGFGAGPPGKASLGLTTVAELTKACGAETRIHSREPAGTRIELIFSRRNGHRPADLISEPRGTA